jgi:hypothetical protein
MRICYIHNGPREQCDDCGGCTCVHAFDNMPPSKMPYFGTVPGGANDTKEYRFHRDFDKGMNEYKKARDEGLQPAQTTIDAVETAQNQVRSQTKAAKLLKNETDLDGLNFAAGVDV